MPAASVVLVEDSPPYARLLELVLADALPGGIEVRSHGRLADALADLRERDADCVLLDLGLPDADGLEGLAALRAAGIRAPIVVLSGHDDDTLAVEALRAGAQDYLVKGEERAAGAFVKAIRFAIERRRAQERSEDLLRAREDRWRTLTHLAPVGIVEASPDGHCVFANDRVSEMLARPREALLGLRWRDALDPAELEAFDGAWRQAVAGDGEFSREVRFLSPAGGPIWIHLTAVLLRDPGGAPAGWLATLVDVTAARRTRDELRAAERELRGQQDDVLALAALARAASVADDPVPLLCDGAREVLGARAVELLEPGATGEGMLERVVHGDEEVGVLRVDLGAPVAAAPAARAATLVRLLAAELGAAVERRRLLDRLRGLARTDPLTGLANRRLWDERLSVEVARAERYGRPLCLVALDLDRFKDYNDRHGHPAGDVLLREAAAGWRRVLRASDLLARLGGDEFALLLPDCEVGVARGIVERLQRLTPGAQEGVGCSAGLVCRRDGESGAAAMGRADAALYAAKAEGRGGVTVG
jgi:diguanylate cyclase (GGDEF)-like protein/PAS domain S-box-containing protein